MDPTHEGQHNTTEAVVLRQQNAGRRWLRRGVLALAVLALASAGAATVAGFAARQSWRWELLCHFRVQYFWALALTSVVLLLLKRWLLGAAALLLAVANLAVIAPLYFAPHQTTANNKPVRILSSNVHFLNREFAPLIELIEREMPDVVWLMEVTPAWIEKLAVLDADYPHSKLMPSHRPDGVALYSRYPIASLDIKRIQGIWLPTIVATLELPPGNLTLVALHPASPGSAWNHDARNAQLLAAAELAAQQNGPVLMLGDFNTTSWSPVFADVLEISGLRDSRLGYGVQPTWPGLPLPLRIPIDHCLVSPEISITGRRVGPSVGSDHRPLVVDFAY